MSNIKIVHAAAVACLKKAQELYNVDMSQVQIRFDLKGTAAGIAAMEYINGKSRLAYVRFNTTMINGSGFEHVLNDTVPHEVAHLVGFMTCRDNGHGTFWRNACIALGGSGQTHHNEEVVYAKGKTYEYTCTQGTQHRFSEQRHKKIQRGSSYSLRKGGDVNKTCSYEVVGISGNPVKTTKQVEPIKPTAAKKPLPTKATAKQSLAALIREAILRCKRMEFARDIAVDYGVEDLGMARALARTYVNNNWDKVEA